MHGYGATNLSVVAPSFPEWLGYVDRFVMARHTCLLRALTSKAFLSKSGSSTRMEGAVAVERLRSASTQKPGSSGGCLTAPSVHLATGHGDIQQEFIRLDPVSG